MTTVWTVGYQDRTVDDVIDVLSTAGVEVLVDVRLTPLSRKPGLSKHRLAARLASERRIFTSAAANSSRSS